MKTNKIKSAPKKLICTAPTQTIITPTTKQQTTISQPIRPTSTNKTSSTITPHKTTSAQKTQPIH